MHDAGEKIVLGRKLPAGRGIEDGEDVLDMLARSPATARYIATKLVRRFVADDPPLLEPGDEVVYAWRSFEAYPIVVAVLTALNLNKLPLIGNSLALVVLTQLAPSSREASARW